MEKKKCSKPPTSHRNPHKIHQIPRNPQEAHLSPFLLTAPQHLQIRRQRLRRRRRDGHRAALRGVVAWPKRQWMGLKWGPKVSQNGWKKTLDAVD